MCATIMSSDGSVSLQEVPTPVLQGDGDAIVRLTASCICGSDLHPYRSGLRGADTKPAGHEFVGIVEEVDSAVTSLTPGDFVIAPFAISDGTCANCRNGVTTSCLHGGFWGGTDASGGAIGGGQAEYARVPQADGTLVVVGRDVEDELVPHLLALSDVMGTGHHAAVSAGVTKGSTVVVGDGAVGLCGILAAQRLGASRIVAMSRHADRQVLARTFGATDILYERGPEAVEAVKALFDGLGADCVLECVGTNESMEQAVGSARPGGRIGFVGVPSGALPTGALFQNDLHYAGGVAPVRIYIPDLLADVLNGSLRPSDVFDLTLPLDRVAEGYDAMDHRQATKVLLTP